MLASESPRRRDLLRGAGVDFRVEAAAIEEVHRPGELARDYVSRLAFEKAAVVLSNPLHGVLAADTIVVVLDGTAESILEKPRDARDAKEMLAAIAGRVHTVMTGVCFLYQTRAYRCVEETKVHFAPMKQEEIEAYIASGEPFGKAGAYAIQGLGARYVERVEGCYFNVVGLPIHRTFQLFEQAGVLR